MVQSTKGLKLNGKKNLITSEEAAAIREKFKHVKDPEIRKIMEKNYWLEMENEALKKLELSVVETIIIKIFVCKRQKWSFRQA